MLHKKGICIWNSCTTSHNDMYAYVIKKKKRKKERKNKAIGITLWTFTFRDVQYLVVEQRLRTFHRNVEMTMHNLLIKLLESTKDMCVRIHTSPRSIYLFIISVYTAYSYISFLLQRSANIVNVTLRSRREYFGMTNFITSFNTRSLNLY